ncbi:MAG: hypothetical protein ABFS19_02460 [Thermodesulfobacteriota bacterium]
MSSEEQINDDSRGVSSSVLIYITIGGWILLYLFLASRGGPG